MKLKFNGSENPTVGIEMEFQLIDKDSCDLVPLSEQILNITRSNGEKRITAEIHQSQIEINSEIGNTISECSLYLKNRIEYLVDIVEQFDLKLAVTGTHPFQKWPERLISNYDRYHNLHKKYQWIFRRMNVYGLHVHIGVKNGNRAIAISNELTKYLPHLIALSANSPFWQSLDTGMKSSRINLLESFPFSRATTIFSNWSDFEYYYEVLHEAHAITSLKDLYWHVRPNPIFGTIEVRICDATPTLTETLSIAALIQCLVVSIDEQIESQTQPHFNKECFWIAPENNWIAARDGLDGLIICNTTGRREKILDSILRLIDQLSPIAERLKCAQELDQIKMILSKGNGADQQRVIYNETNSYQQVILGMMDRFYSDLMSYHPNHR